MNRRCFLKTTTGATAMLACRPAWSAGNQPARNDAAELLAQCDERIEKHRKADGVVVVRGADGQPAPGARVQIEQLGHEFLFGCNCFRFGRVADAEREAQYRHRFADLLNYATLAFYWAAYERDRGHPDYDYTERVLDWCQAHRITCKGHPLAWDHNAGSPRWLPANLDEVQRLSVGRVRDCVTRFKGRIHLWDVVNEPTDLTRFKTRMNDFARKLGAVPFTRLHLQTARAANPQATLLVNDYRTDAAFYKILTALREHDRLPFDTVGIQSHMHGGGWPLKKIWDVCDRYARLDLPIHFTETTIVSGPRLAGRRWGPTTPALEAKQADYVTQFYTMLFAHPAVQALTWWDFSDDAAWQGAAAGLLRQDMSPKPVYDRLKSLIKGRWWTQTEGRTDTHGEFSARAFCGAYRLTAQSPNGRTVSQEVHWTRGQENRFTLRVS